MNEITPRQAEVLKYIADFSDKKGFPPTIREIGGNFHIAPSSVLDHLKALEKKGFIKRSKTRARSIELTRTEKPPWKEEATELPIVGQIAAGRPILAVENIEGSLLVPCKILKEEADFLLKVKGESMQGEGILEGDYVMVRKQTGASNGEIVVALIEDEATIKKFYQKGKQVILQAAHPAYPELKLKEVAIIGKVVGLIRSYK